MEQKILLQRGTKPTELHYHYYTAAKYEEDIRIAIPGYEKMNELIKQTLVEYFQKRNRKITVLELGIGTGLTAEIVLENTNVGKYTGIDFSDAMLDGAKVRLKQYIPELVYGDYAKIKFPKENDLVISVISIHHQATDRDKQILFKKIYDSLAPDGIFIFGDLFTQKNERDIALNKAHHLHHLVENAADEKTLTEWAHHYEFVNHLAPLEDQMQWLKECGFAKVKLLFSKFNTSLIVAEKNTQKKG